MDIRVQAANTGYLQADKLYQQNRSQSPETSANEEANFLRTLIEKEEQLQVAPARDAVLSGPEMATLHVLFGSEKPDDLSFYGKHNGPQIYKGHLLDVAG